MNNNEPRYKEPSLSNDNSKVIIQEHMKLKQSSRMNIFWER